MKTDKRTYKKMTEQAAPGSNKLADFAMAFLIGGLICVIGQLITEGFTALGLSDSQLKMIVPSTLIFLAAMLTAAQVYDDIAKHAGAGTLVPITGFANAIASNAVEYKSEGNIFGVGVKMFTVAGPVIVYGTAASVIYGIIYWLMTAV